MNMLYSLSKGSQFYGATSSEAAGELLVINLDLGW